jgi:mercuric ion binding protein
VHRCFIEEDNLTINRLVLIALVALSVAYSIALTQSVWADGVDASSHESRIFAFDNMTCAACPITVRKTMSRVDGVVRIAVDFKTRTATATYHPDRATPQELAAASTGVGFPATLIDKESNDE